MSRAQSILIVEDEAILAMTLERMLLRLGYEACAKVASGEDAIKLYPEKLPDLVLLDIQLRTEMTGLEAARILRSRFGAIRIAFMTAYGTEEIRAEADSIQPLAILKKPIGESAIKALLDQIRD